VSEIVPASFDNINHIERFQSLIKIRMGCSNCRRGEG